MRRVTVGNLLIVSLLLLSYVVFSVPGVLSKENESYFFDDPPKEKSPSQSQRVSRPGDGASTSSSPSGSATEPFKLNVQKLDSAIDENQLKGGTRLQRQTDMPPLAPSLKAGVAGGQFRLNADTSDFNGTAGQPRLDGLKPKLEGLAIDQAFPTLKGGLSTIRPLADYDVELIIDQSMSMRRKDCPGGLSRWQWCGVQANELARALSQVAPGGLTITTFADRYDVLRNANPADVEQLFTTNNFSFGTRLSAPLKNRLNSYFDNKTPKSKPLLIAVITDGVPQPQPLQPVLVADTLVNASKRIQDPRDVTVVFFQIGGQNRFGRAFLATMDYGLMRMGAHHDFVRTVEFDELQRVGLAQSLVDSVKQFAATSQKRLDSQQ